MASLDVAEHERIVELYRGGHSMKQIARDTGRALSTIHRALHRGGVKVRPTGVAYTRVYGSHEHFERTVELYREGFTVGQIASLLGCAQGTVSYRLRRAGEPIRGRPRRPPRERDLGRVSVTPLVPLLERLEAEHGVNGTAALAGVSDRTLREWREQRREANVVAVDRLLTRAGVLWHDVFDPQDPVARLAFTGEP